MEVKQEPENPSIEEYKIDIEKLSNPSETITESWNYEKDNIKSGIVKNEFVLIKQENDIDLQFDNSQTCIEVKSEIDVADIKCNSIQLSDIKQSQKGLPLDGRIIKKRNQATDRGISIDADVKDEIEVVDHKFKEELDKKPEYVNIADLKLFSNEIVINDRICHCSKTDNNTVKCEICSKDPQQRQSGENEPCQINGKSSVSRTDEKSDICFSSSTQKHLYRNLGTHTKEKQFNCHVCTKSFSEKSHLNKHLRIHTGEKPYECDVCKKSFTQNDHLKRHLRTHTNEKPFKCDICTKSFPRKDILNKHLSAHTGEKPFKCNVCTKSLSLKANLNNHLRIHAGEKPFKCNVCTKSFSQKHHLNGHLRIHSGEKPFKCNFCTRSFSQKHHLNEHLRIHTGEKPFACNICTKSFSRKGYLNGHLRIHTGEKPFTCNVCTKSFSRKFLLNEHLRLHKDEKP